MNLEKTAQALKNRGFEVRIFAAAADAAEAVLAECRGKSVGIGGSKTLEALDVYDRLTEEGEVYWHWKRKEPLIREKAAAAQVYLSSANALAESGEIVNIDGTGNRLASQIYGHEKVIFVIGQNKIASDLNAAINRARNVAAPLNARRFGLKTPCAVCEPMRCHDCASEQRICRALSILMEKPGGIGEALVFLVREELGY